MENVRWVLLRLTDDPECADCTAPASNPAVVVATFRHVPPLPEGRTLEGIDRDIVEAIAASGLWQGGIR